MQSILIVDDEPNYQIVLSELLKDEGYEVFTADSAIDALPIVRNTDLDLILTDMKMPGMDGIEFLQKIKEFNRELPVILITAYAEVERAVEAMHLGAFTYLAKPFSNQQLLASARKAMEQALQIDANFFPAIGELAVIDNAENHPDEARARLEAAIGQQPGNIPAFQWLLVLRAAHGAE